MLNYFLCCQESFEEGDEIWFSEYTHNGLYLVNRRTKEISRMATFPGEKGIVSMLYKAIVRIKDWLVFIPCAAKEIAVYNYKTTQIKKIALRTVTVEHRVKYQEEYKFWTAIPYAKYVYLFGLCYPAILRLNPETGDVVYYTEWIEELDKRIRGDRPGYWADHIIRGKYVYLPCLCASAVVKFDLERDKIEIIDIKSDIEGFFGIEDDGIDLWMISWKCQDIIKWNPDSGMIKNIKIDYRSDNAFPFQKPLLVDKKLYLFPYSESKDVYKIDLENERAELCRELSDKMNIKKKDYATGYITVLNLRVIKEGLISYIHGGDYSWHVYDVRTGKEITFRLETDWEKKRYIDRLYLNDKIKEKIILFENQEETLQLFCDSIEKEHLNKISALNKKIGRTVYKTIME